MKVTESQFQKMTDQEKQSFLAEVMGPAIFSNMVSQGLIDTTKISDSGYLKTVISKNLRETIREMKIIPELDEEFISIAKLSIENGKPLPAIVLIATALEHKINIFYRRVLSMHKMSDKEITSLIRRMDFNSKITWLIKLSTGKEIPKDLQKKIYLIIELRNAIVHYKAVPWPIDTEQPIVSYAKIQQGLEKINLDDAMRTVIDLENFLEVELRNIYPSIDIADSIIETLNNSE